jgi:hypothetical protein
VLLAHTVHGAQRAVQGSACRRWWHQQPRHGVLLVVPGSWWGMHGALLKSLRRPSQLLYGMACCVQSAQQHGAVYGTHVAALTVQTAEVVHGCCWRTAAPCAAGLRSAGHCVLLAHAVLGVLSTAVPATRGGISWHVMEYCKRAY